jgi:hypothetical protein
VGWWRKRNKEANKEDSIKKTPAKTESDVHKHFIQVAAK